MRRRVLVAAMAMAAFGSVAMGGVAQAQSRFEGAWVGGWSDRGSGQSGRLALQIDGDGSVDGTVTNAVLRATSPITGRAAPDGQLRLTYSYGRVQYFANGTLVRVGTHLTGRVGFYLPSGQRLGFGVFALTQTGGGESAGGPSGGSQGGRGQSGRGGAEAGSVDRPGSDGAPGPGSAPTPPTGGGGRLKPPVAQSDDD